MNTTKLIRVSQDDMKPETFYVVRYGIDKEIAIGQTTEKKRSGSIDFITHNGVDEVGEMFDDNEYFELVFTEESFA